MKLALRMGRTLEELLRTMSSVEFNLWCELYNEDLLGELQDYERAGIIASTIANFSGKMLAQGAEPLRPRDFMPDLCNSEEAQVEAEPDPVAFFTAVSNSMLTGR